MLHNDCAIKPEDYDLSIVQPNLTSRTLEKLLKKHALAKDCVILDVWCRTGRLTRMLANLKPNATIFGLDSEEAMLSFASAQPSVHANIHYHHTNYTRMAENVKTKADMVISAWHADYLSAEERADCLSELKACMKPGGILVLQHGTGKSVLHDCIHAVIKSPEWESLFAESHLHSPHYSFADNLVEQETVQYEYHTTNEMIKFKNRDEFKHYVRTLFLKEWPRLNSDERLEQAILDQVVDQYLQQNPTKGSLISLTVPTHLQIVRMPALVDAIQNAGGSPLARRSGEEAPQKSELLRCGY